MGTEEGCSEAASRPLFDDIAIDPTPADLHDADLRRLTAAQLVTLAELTASGVALFFVTYLLQPLVFAHVNGFQVLGAELPATSGRATPMRLLERWAELAFSADATATTFMIGRYTQNGPRLGVCLPV